MIDPRLVQVQQACPAWFSIERVAGDELLGVARPLGTCWTESGVPLRMTASFRVTVGETRPGAVFPARCPERHIQANQTFCLGLAPVQPSAPETAEQFWEQLRQYMVCQHVAELTGIWPPAHALSHGDAGVPHERALAIAAELGLSDEYDRARLDEPSWITDKSLRIVSPSGTLLNGRAACPRGCRHDRRPHRPILRRDCKRRDLVAELVLRERDRRRELARYWEAAIADGERCCGRMQSCGLPL